MAEHLATLESTSLYWKCFRFAMRFNFRFLLTVEGLSRRFQIVKRVQLVLFPWCALESCWGLCFLVCWGVFVVCVGVFLVNCVWKTLVRLTCQTTSATMTPHGRMNTKIKHQRRRYIYYNVLFYRSRLWNVYSLKLV